jgi:glycosyltransferase involved in cell wall biosynthesis
MPPEEPPVTVDVVMPARNEAPTVAANVAAAAGCRYVREVIVVDDASIDGTGDLAAGAGARVIRRATGGSKAHAMDDGVRASDASHILFVDADCTGLTSAHLDAICEPVVAGEAEMSLGAFDYGPLTWLVLVLPPLSGERIIPRWAWDAIPPERLDGYTIESRIDQVIAEGRHRTSARRMRGVFHRTKRDKLGKLVGIRGTIRMYVDLFGLLRPFGDVRWRTYWWYLRGLSIDRP